MIMLTAYGRHPAFSGRETMLFDQILSCTVMGIIKFKLFPVPVRLHSGSGRLKFSRYFTMFSDIKER